VDELRIAYYHPVRDFYISQDKTEIIHRLVDLGKYYFLSRPRRFGKSLLLSTIKALFEGRRELFDGLWVHDQWDWELKHPVIYLEHPQATYGDW